MSSRDAQPHRSLPVGFGPFEFDGTSGELKKSGIRLRLGGQALRILELLLERSGQTVSRDEIQKDLWGDETFVDFEHGLNAAINKLRQALGDSADEPRYIETLPGRGYRFIASVRPIPPLALFPTSTSKTATDEVSPKPGLPPGPATRFSNLRLNARTDDVLAPAVSEEAAAESPVAAAGVPRSRQLRFAWAVAGVSIIALVIVTVFAVIRMGRVPVPDATQFTIGPPPNTQFAPGAFSPFALSPDGRRLAFIAGGQLWVRSLNSLDAVPLAGTDGVTIIPFWSPDSRSIAFQAQNRLKKIDAIGGPAQLLCDAPGTLSGGSWNRDGTIIFSAGMGESAPTRILRVSANGGTPTVIKLDPEREEGSRTYPWFLPDGRHFLYYFRQHIFLGSLDSPDTRELIAADSKAIFVSPGYLLFARQRALMAQTFDPDSATLSGEPFQVAQQLVRYSPQGHASFSASDTGVVATWAGSDPLTQLTWFDRSGRSTGLVGMPFNYYAWPSISADGKQVAFHMHDPSNATGDVRITDLNRTTTMRMTFQTHDDVAVFSPDGSEIAFAHADGVYRKRSNGTGDEQLLLKGRMLPDSWSRDGRFLILESNTRDNLVMLPLGSERKPVPLFPGPSRKRNGQISPDGHWIAYQSDESKAWQVYVETMPLSGGRWQISIDGGGQPRWRRDGRELYYLTPDRKLMAVDINANGGALEPSTPHLLFQTNVFSGVDGDRAYDVAPDGSRFLIINRLETEQQPITVTLNWMAGARK